MGRAMVGAALLAAGFLSGCAMQGPGSMPVASAMPDARAVADTPSGFISFCMRFADQCVGTPGNVSTITLNDQTWKTLSQINRKVNGAIWPEDDQKHYGRAEYWTIPTDGLGDCDDYAVTKRKELLAAGLPSSALRLAVVYSPRTERHAVLTVATNKGDLVLDNMTDAILSWNATDFVWIERQAATNPMQWVSLRPGLITDNANLPTADFSLAESPGAPTSGTAVHAEPHAKTTLDGRYPVQNQSQFSP